MLLFCVPFLLIYKGVTTERREVIRMPKKKKKTMRELILKVPKGTDHFLRSGSGSHGTKSRRTERRKFRQSSNKEEA